MLTEKEIEHLAKLSKLNLTPQEKESFQKGLDNIVEFLGQLSSIDTSKVKETWEESPMHCFTKEEDFENPKALLSNSKHQKGDFIGVKTSLSE